MAKTKAQIIAEAQVVKNATEVGENTATRVGTVLEDLASDGTTFSTGEFIGDVGIDATPTQGSNNLVKSGGVAEALEQFVGNISTEDTVLEDVEIETPIRNFGIVLNLTNIVADTIPSVFPSNQTLTINLSPASGYKLPNSVTVSGATIVSYTKSTGELILEQPTEDVIVTAIGSVATLYTIGYSLTNITATTAPTDIYEEGHATIVIEADTDYILPSSVSVTNATLQSYDAATGEIVIANPSDNVVVSAEGVATNVKITFADATVKSKLVALYDTSGDGELTTAEAAVPTSIPYATFRNNTEITSFDEFQYFINVTSVVGNQFQNCSALASVVMPSGVTSIGGNAFYGTAITSITIPNSVTSIGNTAFQGSHLESVVIPNSVTSLGTQVFRGCTHLTSATLGNGCSSIGNIFYGCSNLTSVVIPEGVQVIGSSFLYNCSSLTTLTLPSTITELNGAIAANSGLKTLTILATTPPTNSSSTKILASTPIETIYVPAGCKAAYDNAPAWSSYASKIVELT